MVLAATSDVTVAFSAAALSPALKMAAQSNGWTILRCPVASQSLRQISSLKSRVVVVEMIHSEDEAVDLLRLLSGHCRRVNVVAVTSFHTPTLEKLARGLGVVSYITAPQAEQVEQTVNRLLHQSSTHASAAYPQTLPQRAACVVNGDTLQRALRGAARTLSVLALVLLLASFLKPWISNAMAGNDEAGIVPRPLIAPEDRWQQTSRPLKSADLKPQISPACLVLDRHDQRNLHRPGRTVALSKTVPPACESVYAGLTSE